MHIEQKLDRVGLQVCGKYGFKESSAPVALQRPLFSGTAHARLLPFVSFATQEDYVFGR